MNEQIAWLVFGIVTMIAGTMMLTAIFTLRIATDGEMWTVCIEAGRSMVNGVCL